MKEELRELLYKYIDRSNELQESYDEAEENDDDTETIECLQRQCRIMIAELWNVMVKVGALDNDEVDFGSIKRR